MHVSYLCMIEHSLGKMELHSGSVHWNSRRWDSQANRILGRRKKTEVVPRRARFLVPVEDNNSVDLQHPKERADGRVLQRWRRGQASGNGCLWDQEWWLERLPLIIKGKENASCHVFSPQCCSSMIIQFLKLPRPNQIVAMLLNNNVCCLDPIRWLACQFMCSFQYIYMDACHVTHEWRYAAEMLDHWLSLLIM